MYKKLLVILTLALLAFAGSISAQELETTVLTFDRDTTSTTDVIETVRFSPACNIYFEIPDALDDAAITYNHAFSARLWDTDFEDSGSLVAAENDSSSVTLDLDSSSIYSITGSVGQGNLVVYLSGCNTLPSDGEDSNVVGEGTGTNGAGEGANGSNGGNGGEGNGNAQNCVATEYSPAEYGSSFNLNGGIAIASMYTEAVNGNPFGAQPHIVLIIDYTPTGTFQFQNWTRGAVWIFPASCPLSIVQSNAYRHSGEIGGAPVMGAGIGFDGELWGRYLV